MKEYFLDNASTTRPYKEVADVVYDTMINLWKYMILIYYNYMKMNKQSKFSTE